MFKELLPKIIRHGLTALVSIIIYAGASLSGAVSFDWQVAVQKALNPDAALASYVEGTLDETKADIVDAVQAEKPELTNQVVTEIKPDEPAQ